MEHLRRLEPVMMRLHDDRAVFRPEGLTTRPHTDLYLTLSHLGDLIHSQPGGDSAPPPPVTLVSFIQIKPNLVWR